MSFLPLPVSKLWADDRGQDIAEYAVMLAVILVLVVGTIRLIGSNANNVFSEVSSSVQSRSTNGFSEENNLAPSLDGRVPRMSGCERGHTPHPRFWRSGAMSATLSVPFLRRFVGRKEGDLGWPG